MSDSESPEERRVELGPFFLAGVVLVAYGLLRRRAVVTAAGLGAIWFDQRSELGRSLKEKARAKYMTVQYVQDGPDRPNGQSKSSSNQERINEPG